MKHDKDNSKEEFAKIEIGKISFTFTITRDEADAVINKPRTKIAKNMRRYMLKILEESAKKFLESDKNENVKNCKINIDNT